MPIFAEKFVVVGDQGDVEYAAQRWRFLGGPGQTYQPSPEAVQQVAQATPQAQVTGDWTVGTDAGVHIDALQHLLGAGISPFVHAPQSDPHKVIDFYGEQVLSHLAA